MGYGAMKFSGTAIFNNEKLLKQIEVQQGNCALAGGGEKVTCTPRGIPVPIAAGVLCKSKFVSKSCHKVSCSAGELVAGF